MTGSEELGSSEEEGKDWDELEAEAKRGSHLLYEFSSLKLRFVSVLTNIARPFLDEDFLSSINFHRL